MFGKDYTFEYDVRTTLDKLAQYPDDIAWFAKTINHTVPDFMARYLKAVVASLEYKDFGKDDMLQEGASALLAVLPSPRLRADDASAQRSPRQQRAVSCASRSSTSCRTARPTATRSSSMASTECRLSRSISAPTSTTQVVTLWTASKVRSSSMAVYS